MVVVIMISGLAGFVLHRAGGFRGAGLHGELRQNVSKDAAASSLLATKGTNGLN